jgi:hypothetical protein
MHQRSEAPRLYTRGFLRRRVEFLLTGEVVCLYPVEVQNNVDGDKAEKYCSAGFVKKSEDFKREMVAKQYRCCLVDKKQKQNRI